MIEDMSNDISQVRIYQQSKLADAIYDLNRDKPEENEYSFSGVCPRDIVAILEDYSEFDEWIYACEPVERFICKMFITGNKKIVAEFNFWCGTVILRGDENLD